MHFVNLQLVNSTRSLGNVRSHMMFRTHPSTFEFISLLNEEEKEEVQIISYLSANNKRWIRAPMRLAINESTGRDTPKNEY